MGNKISRQLEIAKSTNELDISYMELASLPSSAYSLKKTLTGLSLASNKFKSLAGSKLDSFKQLTSLDVSGNLLTVFPVEVLSLKLTSLNLGFNKITTLSPDIGRMVTLTSLDLSGNQITVIPPEIGQLVNLVSLNLEKNLLTDLPLQLGQLKIKTIGVKGNKFKTPPVALANLKNVENIDLSGGDIVTLEVPFIEAMSKCKTFKVLDLSKNDIKKLPPQTTELFNLRELDVSGNPIKEWNDKVKQMMCIKFPFDEEMKAQLWKT